MHTQVSRMQFLRGDFRGKERPIRPPGAVTESLFTEICTACGDCIDQCPENIIHSGRGRYPVIDFSAGECTFCDACIDACTVNALLKQHDGHWQLAAFVDKDRCIAYQGVECRSCHDPCATGAISMRPRPGGISLPRVNRDSCNGCGACIAPCPVKAIQIQHTDIDELER